MRYPEAETNTGSRLAGERTTVTQTVGDHGCFLHLHESKCNYAANSAAQPSLIPYDASGCFANTFPHVSVWPGRIWRKLFICSV